MDKTLDAQAAGFAVILVFIGLESSELCTARVAQRVEEGGHDVPDEKILGRYPRTLTNLGKAIPIVDHVYLFDNSSYDEPYRFVASYRRGRLRRRVDPLPPWAQELSRLRRRTQRPRQGPGERLRRAQERGALPTRRTKGETG